MPDTFADVGGGHVFWMRADDFREHLPLRFDHTFRLFSYTNGLRALRLRGERDMPGRPLYIGFLNVVAMRLKHKYEGLLITEADDTVVIDRFASAPAGRGHKVMRLAVGDEKSMGFVVCGVVDVRDSLPQRDQ